MVFAAAALGLLSSDARFGGFGLTEHPVIGAALYGFALLIAAFELLPSVADLRRRRSSAFLGSAEELPTTDRQVT